MISWVAKAMVARENKAAAKVWNNESAEIRVTSDSLASVPLWSLLCMCECTMVTPPMVWQW